ncbi:GlcG/HbpS family heme-binding protein [Nocardioides rubriscoriae]|uniref:GlcG/HbpS family heme-binding protein n=1 Tax=Nocardioides rubriscoriae TaxID=642762 RepID=UPI0011E06B15|nr:heme-binding protein [Nocardioides rubriscoriae]
MDQLTTQAVQDALAAATRAASTYPDEAFATCIVDAGGHVLGALRPAEATIAAGHSAETKARTAAYLRADTGGLPPDSPYVPAMVSGLPYPVNVFAGGLLVRHEGRVLGAVGVGGSLDPARDTAVAQAARAALVGSDG